MKARRFIFRLVALAAILILVPTFCIWSTRDTVGTSPTAERAAVRDLPGGATDVSWFLPGMFGAMRFYEFTIDEAGYENWVRREGRPKLLGPKRGPFQVWRYDPQAGAQVSRQLANTIAYTWSEEDRGVYLVYDVDGRRAYYWDHTR